MAFMDEMLCLVGLDKEIIPYPFRISLFGKGAVAVEGVKSIESFSEEMVALRLKGALLIIEGKHLKIAKYGEGEVALRGEINGVCFK